MNIHAVLSQLATIENKRVGAGVSDEHITELENRLRVRLPYSYKVFLRTCGWLEVGHYAVYGWGADVPTHLNILRITEWERNETEASLPHSLVPIYNNGVGDLDCLATHRMFEGECPVVAWHHEEGWE